jgi:hypothetical protein
MTDDLERRLMAAGLSKQQVRSVTAETLVQLFTSDDGKILMREAKEQVEEMRKLVDGLKKEYKDIQEKIGSMSDIVTAINNAQEEYGSFTDDRARNALALYAALLNMNAKAGASSDDCVRNAGYIVYAYLGGQAKREVSYSESRES